MNILVIPDKFKGTLTASEAARAIARGWSKSRPRDELTLLPMSDGGDGFGEVLGRLLKAERRTTRTVDDAHRPCRADWWWEPGSKTAVIESAKAIGLAMLPPGRFHPFELDTYGLGAVYKAAARLGARRCLLGIGGSATNDGGFGLARALGWSFLDHSRHPIERWTDLNRLNKIAPPPSDSTPHVSSFTFHPPRCTVVAAPDVQNPLLGARGATRVFGPQKGLRGEDSKVAEAALRRLARVASEDLGSDFAGEPGAGAAGGLGFGLKALLGATLTPGFDLFAEHSALRDHLRRADLVVTGEGSLDHSTLMGKGVGRIAELCQENQIPCIALTGTLCESPGLRRAFADLAAMTRLTTIRQAMSEPSRWLAELASRVADRDPST